MGKEWVLCDRSLNRTNDSNMQCVLAKYIIEAAVGIMSLETIKCNHFFGCIARAKQKFSDEKIFLATLQPIDTKY